MINSNKKTFGLVAGSVFLAIALIIRSFSFFLPIMGAPAMRISFNGPFLRFPAIVFGPLIGGIVFGLYDLLGFFIVKPDGGYIPMMTVLQILQGLFVGFLWKALKNINVKFFSVFLCILFSVIGIYGLINIFYLSFLTDSAYSEWLREIGNLTAYASAGFVLSCIIGIISVLLGLRFSKVFIKILFCIGIPALLYTTFNTILLRKYLLLENVSFMLLWLPRIAQSLIFIFYNTYFTTILLKIYRKVGKPEEKYE